MRDTTDTPARSDRNVAERPSKSSMFELELFRCHSCGKLWTPDMIRTGGVCTKCGDNKVIRARSITFFEEIKLLWMMFTGKLKLRRL